MFDTLKRDAALCPLLTAAMLAVATPSFAQPTEAQREAEVRHPDLSSAMGSPCCKTVRVNGGKFRNCT